MSEENIIDPKDQSEMEQIKAEAEAAAAESEVKENEVPAEEAVSEEPEGNAEAEKTVEDLPLPGDEEEEKEAQKGKLPSWAKDRVARAKRIAMEKDQENKVMREELKRLQDFTQQALGVNPNAGNIDQNAPKRDQFQDEDSYIDARVQYNIEKKRAQDQMLQAQLQQQKQKMEFTAKVDTVLELGSERYKDFDDTTSVLFSEDFPSNPLMAEAIIDSDFGQDILYFLGKNEKEARRLANMSGTQAVKQIALLEQRFIAKKKVKSPPPPPNNREMGGSKALGGASDIATVAARGSQADFEAMYDQQYGKKKKF